MSEQLVLGLGGTVDYEIAWNRAVIEDLVVAYGIDDAELDARIPVVDERSLVVTLLAFVRDGVGGERFVDSSDIIEAFAARFETRITLGGTCVRAAIAMRSLGVTSLVHLVSIDDHVRALLPDGISWVCSASADSTDPHLIVQFPEGAAVRAGGVDITAPHPNRIIYTNDLPNRELVLSDELGEAVRGARVFLVSGLNTIQDAALLDERVRQIRHHLEADLPNGAVAIYEDAGFHEPAFSRRVRDALVDAVDVYSLNEDELFAYLGRTVDLLDAEAIAAALAEASDMIPATCLVVHTKYWSLALGDHAAEYADALRGGIVMASTRYLVGDGHTAADYARTAALPEKPEGALVAAALEERFRGRLVCRAALVLETDRPSTIGLGDTFIGGFIAALAPDRAFV
jgi:ADP-dependent phosphofructokinase/glucokinase